MRHIFTYTLTIYLSASSDLARLFFHLPPKQIRRRPQQGRPTAHDIHSSIYQSDQAPPSIHPSIHPPTKPSQSQPRPAASPRSGGPADHHIRHARSQLDLCFFNRRPSEQHPHPRRSTRRQPLPALTETGLPGARMSPSSGNEADLTTRSEYWLVIIVLTL